MGWQRNAPQSRALFNLQGSSWSWCCSRPPSQQRTSSSGLCSQERLRSARMCSASSVLVLFPLSLPAFLSLPFFLLLFFLHVCHRCDLAAALALHRSGSAFSFFNKPQLSAASTWRGRPLRAHLMSLALPPWRVTLTLLEAAWLCLGLPSRHASATGPSRGEGKQAKLPAPPLFSES